MNKQSLQRTHCVRNVLAASLAAVGVLAFFDFASNAQEIVRVRDKEDKGENPNRLRSSIELAGYTRPGSPSDTVNEDGKIIAAAFANKDTKKFKVLGATIYFTVFKNMGDDGDTFGTGMPDFDRRFDAGRNFEDAYSPRFDKKAKFLYVYQIVNDRFLNPQVGREKEEKKEGAIKNPLFDPDLKARLETAIPSTEPIQQFALTSSSIRVSSRRGVISATRRLRRMSWMWTPPAGR